MPWCSSVTLTTLSAGRAIQISGTYERRFLNESDEGPDLGRCSDVPAIQKPRRTVG